MSTTVLVLEPARMRARMLADACGLLGNDQNSHIAFRLGKSATLGTLKTCLRQARGRKVVFQAGGTTFTPQMCRLVAQAGTEIVFLVQEYAGVQQVFSQSLEAMRYGVRTTYRTVLDDVQAETLVPWLWMDALLNAGFSRFSFIPAPGLSVSSFASFLVSLYAYWKSDRSSGMEIPLFDELARLGQGGPSRTCLTCGNCGVNYVVEADGDVYPCDRCRERRYLLGNLKHDDQVRLDWRRRDIAFVKESLVHAPACASCPFSRYCHDGCMRLRDEHTRLWRYCGAMKELAPLFERDRLAPSSTVSEEDDTDGLPL